MTIEEAHTFLDNLMVCIEEHPIVADWLVEIADRKTENSSEKPNNCTDCECTDDCTECREAEHGCKDEPKASEIPTGSERSSE